MKTLKTIVITIIVAVLAAIAYAYSGLHDVRATTRHGAVAEWVLSTTVEKSVARRAKEVDVPDLEDERLRLAGINDYEAMCVDCHGAPGKDAAPVGEGLNPHPPDLGDAAEEHTAAELFWITKHGVRMTGMPAWGRTHDDEDLWPVVSFMQALPTLDAAGYQAMLERAKGMGHHAGEEDAHEHSHGEETEQSDPVSGAGDHDHHDHDHAH